MNNSLQQDHTSQTSEIKPEEMHQRTLAMEYFYRNQDFNPQTKPKITLEKPRETETLKVPSQCNRSEKSEKSDRSNRKQKIQLKPKQDESLPSPFEAISQKRREVSPSPKEQIEKSCQNRLKQDAYQQKFYYLQFNKTTLKGLIQRFVEKKEKELKLGSSPQTLEFDLNLQWKIIEVPGTTNLTILKQFLLTLEWLDNSDKDVRIWASRCTTTNFQRHLKQEIKRTNPIIDGDDFILLNALSSWYTVAHLQSKFSFPFFLIQTTTQQTSLFQLPSTKCSNCNNKEVSLCLCLSPIYCQDCSNSNSARLHKIKCKYSTHYELICEKMEVTSLSRLGLVGLKNPDNMCYLNTALQCLLAVQPLTKYFLSRQYFRDLNPSNYLGSFGEVTAKYAQFISQAWCSSQTIYDPKFLRNSLGRFFNPFIQAQDQHDSHQCLSLLLNFLREDLNAAPPPKLYQQEADISIELKDEEELEKAWQKINERNNSIIDDLFTVIIKSKIQCDKCGFTSTTFEPALEIPLPVIAPHTKKVERKSIECLFIHQNSSQKNILVNLVVEKETLPECEDQLRAILNLKSHRKLVFYLLSINGGIERLNYKTNLSRALSELKSNEQQFCCLEYTDEQLSSNSFAVTLVFQHQNKKFNTYENVSFKRPLFFNKLNRPKYGREIFKKILVYLYPRIYLNSGSQSLQVYLNNFLNKPPEFKVFLSTDLINKEVIEIHPEEQIKLSVTYTEITARFDRFAPFKLEDLLTTKKFDIQPLTLSNKNKPQIIVSEDATLAECIDQFQSPELIHGWKCNKCKSNLFRAFRTQTIQQVSNVIIFYFKRFTTASTVLTRRTANQLIKLDDPIKFPQVLDMGEFISGKDSSKDGVKKSKEYRLRAVANHFQSKLGDGSGGHYIAYVQNRHCWFSCNDEMIREISSGDVCTPQAYYLIYEKIE